MNTLVFVLSAFGLGALHALEPGHGKTVVAAYLVGSKGRVRDAITLGGVVTFTHTFTIILLGIITSVAAAYLVPETVHKTMGILSGLLILAVGVWMLRNRFWARSSTSDKLDADHDRGAHDHPHDLDHDHEHDHAHHEHLAMPASLAATVIIWQREATAVDQQPVVEAEARELVLAGSHAHGEVWHEHAVAGERHHHHGWDEDEVGHDHVSDDAGHLHEEQAHTHDYDHPLDHSQAGAHEHDHEHPHANSLGHDHDNGDHEHRHEPAMHSHGGKAHSHAPVDTGRLGLRGLITLGVSGGIVPCPAALAILLAAMAAGSVVTGVGLVLIFSLGLAVVLIAIGVVMVKAANIAGRRLSGGLMGKLSRHASAVSAIVVTLLGVVATARAILEAAGVTLF